MNKIIKNCKIISPDMEMQNACIEIENDYIRAIFPNSDNIPNSINSIDAKGKVAVPGFIDIHTHGAKGYDTTIAATGKDISILMADGAGAIVWDKKNGFKLIDSIVFSDGSKVDKLYGSRKYSPHMDGLVVFKNAVKRMKESVESILERNNLKLDDIDYVVPHQANGRIVEHLSRLLKTDKIFSNIEKYGNTTSATIPIALSEMDLKKGDKIILVSFGTGFTWGACLIEW